MFSGATLIVTWRVKLVGLIALDIMPVVFWSFWMLRLPLRVFLFVPQVQLRVGILIPIQVDISERRVPPWHSSYNSLLGLPVLFVIMAARLLSSLRSPSTSCDPAYLIISFRARSSAIVGDRYTRFIIHCLAG